MPDHILFVAKAFRRALTIPYGQQKTLYTHSAILRFSGKKHRQLGVAIKTKGSFGEIKYRTEFYKDFKILLH